MIESINNFVIYQYDSEEGNIKDDFKTINPFASEAVYTRNFFFARMSDSV